MVYLPASSRSAGMAKRPCALVITLVVMLEPSFLALTTTPSIAASSVDATCPVNWAIACGETRTSDSAAVETPDIHFAIMKDLLVAFSIPQAQSPRRADRRDFGESLRFSLGQFKDAVRGTFGLVIGCPVLILGITPSSCPGFVPGIHVFPAARQPRYGWLRQARPDGRENAERQKDD